MAERPTPKRLDLPTNPFIPPLALLIVLMGAYLALAGQVIWMVVSLVMGHG